MNVLMLAYFSCKASVWYAFLRIGSKGNSTPAFLTQVDFIVCMLGGPQECPCQGWDFVMKDWCLLIELTNWTSPSPKYKGPSMSTYARFFTWKKAGSSLQ